MTKPEPRIQAHLPEVAVADLVEEAKPRPKPVAVLGTELDRVGGVALEAIERLRRAKIA